MMTAHIAPHHSEELGIEIERLESRVDIEVVDLCPNVRYGIVVKDVDIRPVPSK